MMETAIFGIVVFLVGFFFGAWVQRRAGKNRDVSVKAMLGKQKAKVVGEDNDLEDGRSYEHPYRTYRH